MQIQGIKGTLSVLRNSLRVLPDHLEVSLPRAQAVDLFKNSVELIEVETTAYCNRVCGFCPNSFLDRRTERLMPEESWQTILAGLREVEYDGTFVWSRYSEPTSEKGLVERVKQVKDAAPKCRVSINTNGDYLNSEYIYALAEAGVSRLWIDTYVDDEADYNFEIAHAAHAKLLKRIKLSGKLTGDEGEYVYDIPHPTMEITNHIRNVKTMIAFDLSDRGGLIQIARKTVRQSPCYAVYKHLVIDWDGSVVACCQLRSDSPQHKKTVFGQIGSQGLDLVTAYLSLATWRKTLTTYGEKLGPCASCNVSEYEASPFNVAAAAFLADPDSLAAKAAKKIAAPLLKKRQRY
jgi:hypothetical protein